MAAPASGGGIFSKVSMFSGRAGLAAFVILALGTAACAAIGWRAIAQAANYAVAASASAVFLAAFWQLRHLVLALLVASAPITALIWSAAFAPDTPLILLFPLIAFCTTLASLTGHAVAAAIARGDEKVCAISGAAGAMFGPVAGALTAAILVAGCIALIGAGDFKSVWHSLAGVLCGSVAVFGLVVFGAGALVYREDFIARWNRAAERRARVADFLAARVQPHWAWSFTGIALILGTLAVFAARDAGALPDIVPVLGTAAVVFALGFARTRDIRMAAALLLAFGIAAMVALWGYAKAGHGGLLLSQILIVPLLLTYAAAVGKWQRGGNPQTFYFRGVEQNAIAVYCGGLCAFAATTPIIFADGVLGATTFSILVAGVTGAVVFLPAFGLAIESAVPRRRSAEELYRS